MRFLTLMVTLAMAVVSATSQTPAQKPAFEVASIKRRTSPMPQVVIEPQPGGRFVATNATARLLVRFAFNRSLPDQGLLQEAAVFNPTLGIQVFGGPDWISMDRFDVEANARNSSQPISRNEIQLMVQSLLEDRFTLKAHYETRQLPVYDLIIEKTGRMKLSADQTAPASAVDDNKARVNGMERGAFSVTSNPTPSSGMRFLMIANAIPLTVFSKALQMHADRPVIDKTNLKGLFDVRFEFNPQTLSSTPATSGSTAAAIGSPTVADPSGPSLFTALQEQLGLKLESSKGPVDVLVIDSISKPSEN